ncbi:helix-turn-helix domain-containing protein [Streptosporangium sp. G11]|uniref:helix-turn-helix domain-containing protein n=1 Tax=Streptosporangium sp. G11 TaxID=3436926 RepID=UPI003EBA17D1
MRYPEWGGLAAEERAKRERLRFEAAELFAQEVSMSEVAHRFRVTRMSATRWYRSRQVDGVEALASKGPSGEKCRLDARRLERLRAELKRGPAAHGFIADNTTNRLIGTLTLAHRSTDGPGHVTEDGEELEPGIQHSGPQTRGPRVSGAPQAVGCRSGSVSFCALIDRFGENARPPPAQGGSTDESEPEPFN